MILHRYNMWYDMSIHCNIVDNESWNNICTLCHNSSRALVCKPDIMCENIELRRWGISFTDSRKVV